MAVETVSVVWSSKMKRFNDCLCEIRDILRHFFYFFLFWTSNTAIMTCKEAMKEIQEKSVTEMTLFVMTWMDKKVFCSAGEHSGHGPQLRRWVTSLLSSVSSPFVGKDAELVKAGNKTNALAPQAARTFLRFSLRLLRLSISSGMETLHILE